MREVLQVPDTHRIGIVPGSDTGAFEMAMWTMLGARPSPPSHGKASAKVGSPMPSSNSSSIPRSCAPIMASCPIFRGRLVERRAVHLERHHLRRARAQWRLDPADREGLTFATRLRAVFAYDMPWDKIDVPTFSWQKVLGGEGGHGVMILGPRAVERLENYTPAWPLPKVFRLTRRASSAEGVFKGETINTPSMLAVEDAIFALEWAKSVGGLGGLIARSNANADALGQDRRGAPWLGISPPIRRPGPKPRSA
jgi:phosphoserine aminotransferase